MPRVVISVTTTADDLARLPQTEHCREVLRLVFRDADGASGDDSNTSLFSPSQADAVWDLLDRHGDLIERVVVHCDAGLSRSPAIAAAISKGAHRRRRAVFQAISTHYAGVPTAP